MFLGLESAQTLQLVGGLHTSCFAQETYFEVSVQAFGPDRMLFGSDWPVIRLECEYSRRVGVVEKWLERFNVAGRTKIWGENALRVHGLQAHQ